MAAIKKLAEVIVGEIMTKSGTKKHGYVLVKTRNRF
jgi:hypothetical protein